MHSMTGYGKGTGVFDGRELTIELKAVNHRFLDISIKLPRSLLYAEDTIRKTLQKNLSRGHVDVFVTLVDKREGVTGITADKNLAKAYSEIAKEVAKECGVQNDFGVSSILRMPEVITSESVNQDDLLCLVSETTQKAVDGLIEMRAKEGKELISDLVKRVEYMREMVKVIEERAPFVAEDYKTRLTEKLTELLGSNIDEVRILQEVAIFTDRANIDEELTRLKAHFVRFDEYAVSTEPVGRKMDFLVQEMNREINTTGSKSNDTLITEQVLKLKNELEKVREQVQNLE
ncbi:MAG: YicC family protein [Clostridia bacterium]|nr:YicC family protein [Clostridia bacterium]